jgi:hypothetical protein
VCAWLVSMCGIAVDPLQATVRENGRRMCWTWACARACDLLLLLLLLPTETCTPQLSSSSSSFVVENKRKRDIENE